LYRSLFLHLFAVLVVLAQTHQFLLEPTPLILHVSVLSVQSTGAGVGEATGADVLAEASIFTIFSIIASILFILLRIFVSMLSILLSSSSQQEQLEVGLPTGADVDGTGADVDGTGAGVDGTGAGVDGTGAGVDGTGAGVDGTGAGVDGTGAGVDGTGASVNPVP